MSRFSKGDDEKEEEELFGDKDGTNEFQIVSFLQVQRRNHGTEKTYDSLLSVRTECLLLQLDLGEDRGFRGWEFGGVC